MTKEEKEAIEGFKEWQETLYMSENREKINTILNLIEKYKNIAESEKRLHEDFKRQRNDLRRRVLTLNLEKIKLKEKIIELKKEIETLKSDKEQLVYENSLLKNEIKEMIYYDVVKNIICDEFDVSEDEVDDLFGESE